ncbi:tRNA lysidine(34) synthetase TilS [Rheinheimera sp. SA_1]|uniref:tRNA lysidine(34) synthetase TilS n=1 Tax=Rheinheimera sp. SA_1 TaxID=1827365 RepID=UPI0008001267|nr:tRNA lysidine(34) synthetase TilS [Rheinheimera sp. SA_1]OBP15634.1 tRNA lysidine(34) synthetase TilS [Rheinheimera sp. SA_1]
MPDLKPDLTKEPVSHLIRELDAAIELQLQSYAIQNVVLGLSGGLDSTLLLQLLVRWQASAPNRQLQAVHVHHGLSANADAWAVFCQQQCDRLGVPLRIRHIRLATSANIEAQARTLRYQVLTGQLLGSSHNALLTAHHADDQLETLLLALKRGSGPAGLAGISSAKPVGDAWILRPLLNFEREQLEAAAKDLQLSWINDESNLDPRFDRNFLRLEVLPLLKQRWGSIATTASRSLQQLGQVQQVNDHLLQRHLAEISGAEQLSVAGLMQHDDLTQNLLLRLWLKQFGLNPGSERLLRIKQELIQAKADAEPQILLGGHSLRRFAGYLYLLNPSQHQSVMTKPPSLQPLLPGEIVRLADGRRMVWQTQQADFGADASYWPLAVATDASLELGFGWLSYRFKPAGYPHNKPLKQWFKLWKVPPWQRGSVPSIIAGQQILLVVDHGATCGPTAAQSWLSVSAAPQST